MRVTPIVAVKQVKLLKQLQKITTTKLIVLIYIVLNKTLHLNVACEYNWIWTNPHQVKSLLLYQLSYVPYHYMRL